MCRRYLNYFELINFYLINLLILDSGGPLMNDNAENNDRIVLLGIVSFGKKKNC